jgi:hypothetical protein
MARLSVHGLVVDVVGNIAVMSLHYHRNATYYPMMGAVMVS